jgi:hypothetical protein
MKRRITIQLTLSDKTTDGLQTDLAYELKSIATMVMEQTSKVNTVYPLHFRLGCIETKEEIGTVLIEEISE